MSDSDAESVNERAEEDTLTTLVQAIRDGESGEAIDSLLSGESFYEEALFEAIKLAIPSNTILM